MISPLLTYTTFRFKEAPDSPNLLASSFKTPPIAVVFSTLKPMAVQIPKVEPCSSSKTTMVAPPLGLCYQIGYFDGIYFGIEYLPSRGPPKLLLDDLKAFVENRPFSESGESLSAAYLAAEPAGLKHEPPANARKTADLLLWPRNQKTITNLLSQLFTYVMESQASQTQIIDLTGGEVAEIEEAGVAVVAHCNQNRIEYGPSQILTSQTASPITRLYLRDPAMISSLQAAGFTEPFPVTTSNEEDLIQLLERWMASHSDEQPPGSTPFQKQYCGRRLRYAKELIFGSTSEPVWVERVRISASHMAFFLMDDDGSCMLVNPNYTNNNDWRGYHGWLGADLGFTLQTIAQTGSAVKWQPEGMIENFQPEHIGDGGFAEVPHPSELIGEEQSIEKTVSIRPGTAEAERQITIKKEPSRTSTRQAAMRRNQLERQTDEERWRYETPPLSSLDVVKKRRWPPQYVSPPPTPQAQKRLQGRKKTLKAPKSSVSQGSRRQRFSSPGLTSVGLALGKPENAQSRDLDSNNLDKSKTPPPKRSRKKKADTVQMPVSPVSHFSFPSVNKAMPEMTPNTNIILHFFLQRKELGALPTPLAQCDTADQFFDHAEEAWDFLSSRDAASEMAAVSVEVEGVEWPMIIPWRDSFAHQWMMETIAKAAIGRSYDLHVQVKCVTK